MRISGMHASLVSLSSELVKSYWFTTSHMAAAEARQLYAQRLYAFQSNLLVCGIDNTAVSVPNGRNYLDTAV